MSHSLGYLISSHFLIAVFASDIPFNAAEYEAAGLGDNQKEVAEPSASSSNVRPSQKRQRAVRDTASVFSVSPPRIAKKGKARVASPEEEDISDADLFHRMDAAGAEVVAWTSQCFDMYSKGMRLSKEIKFLADQMRERFDE